MDELTTMQTKNFVVLHVLHHFKVTNNQTVGEKSQQRETAVGQCLTDMEIEIRTGIHTSG